MSKPRYFVQKTAHGLYLDHDGQPVCSLQEAYPYEGEQELELLDPGESFVEVELTLSTVQEDSDWEVRLSDDFFAHKPSGFYLWRQGDNLWSPRDKMGGSLKEGLFSKEEAKSLVMEHLKAEYLKYILAQ